MISTKVKAALWGVLNFITDLSLGLARREPSEGAVMIMTISVHALPGTDRESRVLTVPNTATFNPRVRERF